MDYVQDLLDKVDLFETSTQSKSGSLTLEENLSGQQNVTNNYKTNICESCGKASTLNGVVLETSGAYIFMFVFLPTTFLYFYMIQDIFHEIT